MKSANKEIGFGKQTIAKVFEEWYTVPSYQRHYVWESDNVNDMLDDFASNYIEHAKEEYFLGSYIIQSKSNNNDLLDGQQRITTLFLLFAFLRDYAGSSEDVKVNCADLIFQKANKIKQIPERIRLSYEIRGNVRKFIEEYLMTPGSITQHWDDIVKKANDKKECTSIQRMCNALVCYNEFFTNHKEIDLDSFLIFILNNVVMIYISADSLEDAFRLFSVMNDRGQKLSNADILKSSTLEKIEDGSEMNEYAREWENMQEDLGNDFDRFLAYVRTMLLKKRQKTSLLDEYEKQIFKAGKIKQGKDFFNYVFRAYEDYNKLINLAGNEDTEYCSLIRTLIECMPSTDWIPVILAYGRKFGDNGLLEFSQKVACKNIADAVCGKSPSYRIDHLNSIINLIEESGKPSDVLDAQGYYSFNEHVFMANIQSEIYGRRYTYALLMLLEYKYKDKSGMTLQDVANHLQVSWDTVKEIHSIYLQRHYSPPSLKGVCNIGIDEFAVKKGHIYKTIVVDLDTGIILHVGDGKGVGALGSFWKRVKRHKVQIEHVATDLSAAFIASVLENCPKAVHVFDHFHVVKLMNEHLDDIRRKVYAMEKDVNKRKVLKGTRYLLLGNGEDIFDKQHKTRLDNALAMNEPLSKAYYLKEQLREIWAQVSKTEAVAVLNDWVK